MTELLSELEDKRAKHNIEAEKHRRLRDDLNDETRRWVDRRDELNSRVREMIDRANAFRETRDRLNAEVQDLKAQRDQWNRLVISLGETLSQQKREKMPQGGAQLRRLKAQLRALEKKHMTSVLTPDKERALVEEIGSLSSQIQMMEKEYEQFDEIRQLETELREAKRQAETLHKKVSEIAEQAQNAHDDMVQLFEQADELRREADAAQEKFIETKLKADEEHRNHIDNIRQVHDLDKMISGMRQKLRRSKKEKEEDSAKKEAEQIFDKFKSGEALSTEDLMTLQKSGYL